MQREIITIHVKMDRQTFRRFALFDTFRLKKRWCKPALFCAILLVFAAVAFAAGREQSALIGSVLLLVGLGCAPIYPCLLHQTPKNFGAENSQALMGLQMACAYVGSTLMPPLLGVLAGAVNLMLYPIFLLCITVLMFVLSERVNKMVQS